MRADWYFDFVSPFSYLQLGQVLEWRERLEITPVPIVFGAVLKQNGQLGPAEIPGKREFTYRFVQWTAERAGVPLRFPPAHPFNPIAALRLAIAAGTTWPAIVAIFEHIWRYGRAGDDADSVGELARTLGVDDVAAAISHDDVKSRLRANTDAALAAGVFGIPTFAAGGELFWGNDATPMIAEWLDRRDRFHADEYHRLALLPRGIERRR